MTKTERTVAKIGRSMKKCERFIGGRLLNAALPARSVPGCGVTLPPGRARTSPLMMTRSVGARPVRMIRRPSSVIGPGRTTFGSTVPSSFTVITTLRDWSVTTAASGTSIASCCSEAGHANSPELSRSEEIARVRENGAGADRPCAAVHLIVDEIEPPLPRPFLSRRSAAHTPAAACRRARQHAGGGGALIGEVVALAHVEIEIDRVERHDGRQRWRRRRRRRR